MKIPLFQLDAFSDGPFTGNPAAVCPLDTWLPEHVMQSIAAENNLSETAFFVRRVDGAYDLRWFTPAVEVDLCGHATLASGHVVLNKLATELNEVTFNTRSGSLKVARDGNRIAMDFPARLLHPISDERTVSLLDAALGSRPAEVLIAGAHVAVFDSEDQVKALRPDIAAIAKLDVPYVSVTAPAQSGNVDFVSRFFAPGAGIDEDPVTGSAHTWLAPYWSARLGKRALIARQVSKRGGTLWRQTLGDRVLISGRVSEYLEGQITMP